MAKIIQLDDALSNKIAAGEVVERPASVVKELVENSIDAKSTSIEIFIEEAGLQSIRILDNGQGIEEEDVLTAFSRHATSKIKDENDLFRIRTLGFRGEALPSIASVSHVTLTTSIGEQGTTVELKGGHLVKQEGAPGRKGTEIIVSDLFFNTPARLKYMKSIHTELGNITDIVNRLALAHPNVSFRLVHNDRKLLHTNGNGDVRQVLASIYGLNIAKKMIPISASTLDFKLSGYMALPEITRASRNYISTMINGRFIKNYSLVRSIQEGYHTLLPIGRYPIVLLNVEMDPILVDVNVHPSKMEVRFSKEQELYELVSNTIKAAFKKKELIPAGLIREKKPAPKEEQAAFSFDTIREPAIPSIPKTEPTFSIPKVEVEEKSTWNQPVEDAPSSWPAEEVENNPMDSAPFFLGGESNTILPPLPAEVEEETWEEKEIADVVEGSRVPPLYPIGQMHGTYIFAQNERGLYIIDQHAAQERIKYEFFREKVGEVHNELQEMLIPLTLDYSLDEWMKIEENKVELEKVGVFLEPFGQQSYLVRSHPQWFPKGEEKETIEEMIEQVLSMKKVDIKLLREEAAIMMSCKGSIKANRHLRNDEIQSLLDELRTTSDPFTCPHGRPIIVHYSTYEMEKMFKRVM
ncbi:MULTISPECIES: DNA mismatch repair endonuclease MutL [unclassified Niallia]|uniref:DNA mismatch repair endonuclease MutL n=1 Tax=unclassified Niallia TaxID=2837522 RepID=UPI00033295BD|nr:DNA mismatch repair endonuclease MutL [Niallia sp. RD1]EOR26265.1 DNA mismatch repair protein [Niallia nealsonii AAU1]MBQ6447035.1 DNA mismatch repair endonuclease MutL [Bacillus sp. (in: firmicutes)]UTI40639.1 DNA mismatch repair endonuclease MutL [Niallia sp. RD1]